MPRNSLPLLTRLRRHRGLWVLAMAVLLIKLVAGTVCLTDGPNATVGKQATISLDAHAVIDSGTAAGSAGDAGGCALDEAGDCHCACAHTTPMPATAMLSIARLDAHFDSPATYASYAPASPGSLLRPPIA